MKLSRSTQTNGLRYNSSASLNNYPGDRMPSQPKPPNLEKEMIRASKHGATIMVMALLAKDPALISARDVDGSTPLHCATWKGHERLVQVLLKHGADVNATNNNDHWGTTPLHAAAHGNQRAIAELLIAHGADIDVKNLNGRTPLQETEFHKAKPVANLLIKHGAA
jgi:ankyrin repeat protein